MLSHIGRNFGRYLLCGLLMVIGISAFGLATLVDYDYWTSQAKSDLARIEYGGGAIVFRSITFLFACVAAVKLRDKLWGQAFGAGLVLFVFAAIGMTSIIGFGARERMVPQMQADAKYEARKDALAQAQVKADDIRNKQTKFLQDQARAAPGPQSRGVAYDALSRATQLVTIETADEPVKDITDPQAAALNAIVPNISINNWQIITTVAWGISFIVGEMVCMGFAITMLPRYVAAAAEATLVTMTEGGGGEPVAANVVYPDFNRLSQPQKRPVTAELDVAGAMAVPAPKPARAAAQGDLLADIDEVMRPAELVKAFWDNKTVPQGRAKIGATTAFEAYCDYCKEIGEQASKQKRFGIESAKYGIAREALKNSARYYYLGRAIVGEDGQLTMAA